MISSKFMSSPQGNKASANFRRASAPPESPTSSSTTTSSGNDGVSAPNPAGTERTEVAADLLLSAVRDVRQIIRLLQCQICSQILREPSTLPCGHSLCRGCLPDTHVRTNISWPGTESRRQGFECPFADCKKEHAIGDCSVDVTLNKALAVIKSTLDNHRDVAGLADTTTLITVQDPWAIAGVSSLAGSKTESMVLNGGRIVATYTMAHLGMLQYNSDVSHSTNGVEETAVEEMDMAILDGLKESARSEMDCQVCYGLFLDPLTTSCGHTFCRTCVQRVLDHSNLCPICRRALSIQAQATPQNPPSNQRLCQIINGFWADVVALRARAFQLEQQANHGAFDIPLFICALAYPRMPMFLHVFEPRYRLMIRRAMEGDRAFGMVVQNPRAVPGEPDFFEYGTLLRITNIEYFPDGRSLLETVGISRFRITGHRWLDGYVVGSIEKVHDMNLAEEEAMEASETMRAHGVQTFPSSPDGVNSSQAEQSPPARSPPLPISLDDLDTMSTQELIGHCTEFVRSMQAQSVSWLVPRILAIYGDCPSDPVVFPWWFGSILPVREEEKYRLLATSSVRERMKICCRWIVEWESSRWTLSDCLVL